MDTTTNLPTKLHDYAASRSLKFELEELSTPPALLQGLIVAPGICLTVWEPEPASEPPAQLGVWLSTACSEVTCCMMREGDDEIEIKSHTIPDDEARIAFVDHVCRHFYLHYVFLPAIDSWADETNTGYTDLDATELSGKPAELEDSQSWHFLRIGTAKPNDKGTIVGISDDGQAGTFVPGRCGALEFDERIKGIKNRVDIITWLNKLKS